MQQFKFERGHKCRVALIVSEMSHVPKKRKKEKKRQTKASSYAHMWFSIKSKVM